MSKITKSERIIVAKINNLLKKTLLFFIHLFSRWYKQINKINNFDNPSDFEDFTPITLDDKDDKYSEILKYAIENPNTKNIALTGPYGSGKSSILKTFEEKHIENKYLNISLATFDEKEHLLKEIEYCILKQLFYKVEQNKIPESRFKRIINQKNVKIKSLFIFLWLITLTYYFKPNLLNGIAIVFAFDFYSKIGNIIYTLYFLGGAIYLLYKTMGFILNFKLTKFSFQDTEIENGDDKKSVNFENEIDEILYFFERNSFNVVFIEDLDRFKNTEIFIKLREINYLINNYDPIKKKRKITFIYAVQDDTFKEDERAKFFDFIIPVIPVINYSNSSIELLDKIDIDEDVIPKIFIKQVARYLSDKRTLISITNEYKVYKNIIGDDLDKKKLLAMMIYKNVDPTDFDNLNSQKGYVYTVFNNSYELIKSSIDTIDKKIEKINDKLTRSNNEMIQDVIELRSLYIAKFYGKLLNQQDKNILNIQISGNQCTIKQLLIDSNFNLFANLNDIHYYTFNSYNRSNIPTSSGISFETLESEVGTYTERLEIIENKKATKTNEFKKEIEKLESEKQVIRTKKIKDIVTNDYLQKCLEGIQCKESIKVKEIIDEKEAIITKENTIYYKIQNIDLINYLIQYGHIDDSYSHYISYFYPGTITKEDNDFLKSFTNNKPLPYDFKLKEIENLFPDILESDFCREEILNFSLLDFILERNNTEKELAQIIALLSTKIHKPTNFIDEYLIYTINGNKISFLKALCKNWKNPNQNIWEELMSNLSDIKLIEYLNLMFSKLDFPTIQALNIRNNLSNYISEIESLNSFINIDTEITGFILKNNIKFKNTDNQGSKVIFDFIYEKNSYVINIQMILIIVNRYKQNEVDLQLLNTANYTTIKKSNPSNLLKYVNENLELYIKNVFLKLENNTNESEEVIIELLTNEDIKLDLRIKIVNKNETIINDISKIKEVLLWTNLIETNKIDISWENLLYYYEEKKIFDDVLVSYINIHNTKLAQNSITIDFDEENTVENFSTSLINSKISLESFTNLITNKTIPYIYPDGEVFLSKISIDKMKALIQNKVLTLSVENYSFIESKFTGLLILLLETNTDEFIKNIKTYTIDSFTTNDLIISEIFNTEQKLTIIKNTEDSIIIKNKDLSKQVSLFLSKNTKISLSLDLIKELIAKSQSTENKIKLFNLYYGDIEKSELKSIIEQLGEPYSTITKGKVSYFINNEYNLKFVTLLEVDSIFISSKKLSEDGKTIRANLKTGKKIKA